MKQIFLLILTLSILLLSACSAETQMTDVPQNTEKTAESSIPTKVEKKETTTQVESESTSSTVITEPTIEEEPIIKATAWDCSLIADKVIEYINAFRIEESVGSATKLSGLTEYAEYRSQQLVTNFAHDTTDERAAATALQYGDYIDPSLYGATGEPYYRANVREAIAKTSFGGTIDDVAKHIARMAKNSSGHWNYVGGEKYQYIAVGITYENGNWYCCIAMSREDTDNK